jgi:mannose-6-phosphate isomerase-like protein (cupin superfamily)
MADSRTSSINRWPTVGRTGRWTVRTHGTGARRPQAGEPHEGEEFLIVLKGKVEFEFEGKVHSLEEGDSLYFDAETEHRLFNVTDKDARVLCVFLERGE